MISTTNADTDSTPKDLLSPNEPGSASDYDQSTMKINSSHSFSAIASLSSRVYKCLRCERLAPHRWIIERHIRAHHPSDSDHMSNVILEIDKPLTSTNNGEPMTATKSSSSSTSLLTSTSSLGDHDVSTVPSVKAFSCSTCALQSYHLWVILRHIRNVHHNDGSNAKIIDNINNQIIEDDENLAADVSTPTRSTETTNTPNIKDDTSTASEHDEIENEQVTMNNEEMLKHLINTAMATRKTNANNNFFESLPASLMNNNVAASLVTLLGQLTSKQILQQQQQQQQYQTEKNPTIKRYKCSLCSHVSAWGGNVKKHLKRMHPTEHAGHVIDLGHDASMITTQSPSQVPLISIQNESEQQRTSDENNYQQSSELINTKLKDIDNAPTFASASSTNTLTSTHPERLYGCSVCTYECTNPSNIHRHVELHSGDDGGGFQCSQCFFLSKWRASIRKHMMSTHGSSLASLSNVFEPLIISKSEDATVIVKKWLIHENSMKHEDDPNNNNTHTMDTSIFYCSSCPYTNSNRLLFQQHVVQHNLSKNDKTMYTCTFCTFHTNEEDSLEDHQMLHIMKEDFEQDVTGNTLENTIV